MRPGLIASPDVKDFLQSILPGGARGVEDRTFDALVAGPDAPLPGFRCVPSALSSL